VKALGGVSRATRWRAFSARWRAKVKVLDTAALRAFCLVWERFNGDAGAHAALVAENLIRNLDIADKLGCTSAENLELLRRRCR